jgi:hypothetical protein
MDDGQTAFAAQYPSYGFDVDMMKVRFRFFPRRFRPAPSSFQRPMDVASGPDAKKARWSPTSPFSGVNGPNSANTPTRDVFANYGYGPQASISQNGFNSSPTSPGNFNGSPLYSTPTLGINPTVNGNGIASQLSPNAAAAAVFVQQQQQQQQQQQAQAQANGNGNGYGPFGAYSMLGMGIPGMNMLGGFPYNNQMANFAQVTSFVFSLGCRGS